MSEPFKICIVGGGTAGWLAALMLSRQPGGAGALQSGRQVTVVESSKIPTIGVGEGTTALFRQMLQALHLDEMDFLRATGATIKYGIRHQDWRRVGHTYDGPIDDPRAVASVDLDTLAVAAGRSVTETHLFQHLVNANRAPFAPHNGRLVQAGPFHHAYHFDQARAGAWLRHQAKGVTRIDATVTGTQTGPEGIASLTLDDGRQITADLFLDCTGFRRALISELGAQWTDFSDVLPVNRAMPFWIDLAPDEEIAPVTLARALGHGWMWRIPTQDRYGCGYVYSDAHTSPDQAQAEVEAALGHKIHPRADLKIGAGRLAQSWIGNCLALGLSSSFLEPLEATSIHGTIVQLMWLADWLGDPDAPARYNAAAARQVDDFRDFIRLHYVSERRDTQFWRDVAATHPSSITDRLADWGGRLPTRADFTPLPLGLPHVEDTLHIPVLDGLGLLSRDRARTAMAANPHSRKTITKARDGLIPEYRRAAQACVPHRRFLASLNKDKAA